MKTTIRSRLFTGLSFDADSTDLRETDSPLCQDVILTPQGALSTPPGMTKYNTTAYSGMVYGGYAFRSKKGQAVLISVSDGTIIV